MRILYSLSIALSAAFLLAAPAAQAFETMSEADRTALHAEIRAYLLENPEILREMVALLGGQGKAKSAEADRDLVAANAAALFDDGFSFVGGNPDGGFTVVEFLDYQCGYCRRAHPELSRLIEEDERDIRLIVKETRSSARVPNWRPAPRSRPSSPRGRRPT